MGAFGESYVLRVLLATRHPAGDAGAAANRWTSLTATLFDPYRPELHYMRGPGPKWREKHVPDAGRVQRDAGGARSDFDC